MVAFLGTSVSAAERPRILAALKDYGVKSKSIREEKSIKGDENAVVVVGSRDLKGAHELVRRWPGLRVIGAACLEHCLEHDLPFPTPSTDGAVLNNLLDG
eukprot:1411832-Rhodomonas_salina.4